MRKASSITTSFATTAARLRTLNGTKCPSLPRAPSVSGFFANANSFSADSAQRALLRRVSVSEPSRRRGREYEIKDRFVVWQYFTNSKEGKQMDNPHTSVAPPPVPTKQEQALAGEAQCPFAGG